MYKGTTGHSSKREKGKFANYILSEIANSWESPEVEDPKTPYKIIFNALKSETEISFWTIAQNLRKLYIYA